MSKIGIFCHTILDGHAREKWPVELQVRPLIGDRITAESGNHLRVCEIRHAFDGELLVELHK